MYFTIDLNQLLSCREVVSPAVKIPAQVQSVLDNFKRQVKTPSGVKQFFANCSEINKFMDEYSVIAFDMVSDNIHYIYHMGDADRKKIDLIIGEEVFTDYFLEDDYFYQFLTMLSAAIAVSEKQKAEV